MVRANNLGVRCLNDRDFPNAVQAFRSALAIARSNCLKLSSCCATQCSTSASSSEPPCHKRLITHPNAGWESTGIPFAHDGDWTGVYSHGIVLGRTSLCQDPLDNAKCLSGVVIFNLACVFHSQALYESPCQSQMAKAKILYEHSLALISGVHSISTGSIFIDECIDFLYMAALNNMAYLHLELNLEFEGDSSLLFRKLFQHSQSLRIRRIESGTLNSVMDHLIDIFLQNALFSQTKMYILTAAAAA